MHLLYYSSGGGGGGASFDFFQLFLCLDFAFHEEVLEALAVQNAARDDKDSLDCFYSGVFDRFGDCCGGLGLVLIGKTR